MLILYRPIDGLDSTEEDAAKKYFKVVRQRTKIHPWELVIGRYSVLPFYVELEKDICNQGSWLINTYQQHRFVADIRNWVPLLEEFTPKTWERLEDLPEVGPFVLKGETNSRKDRWNTHMYAETKRDAVEVALRLQEDALISTQKIIVRKYEPLVQLMTGLNGLPVTKEFRFFICDRQILSGGFYWSSFVDDLTVIPSPKEVPDDWLSKVIEIIGDNIRFYALDVAQKTDGSWMVVELNDGQMSGLSENDPDVLYRNLMNVLTKI